MLSHTSFGFLFHVACSVSVRYRIRNCTHGTRGARTSRTSAAHIMYVRMLRMTDDGNGVPASLLFHFWCVSDSSHFRPQT